LTSGKKVADMKLISSLTVTATLLFAFSIHADPEDRLKASEFSAYIPELEDGFAEYIAENTDRISNALQLVYADGASPFTGNYALETVVQMRAPYQIDADTARCNDEDTGGIGFLMLHGLTDSPYTLKAMAYSLAQRYPCALLRGLLLPGHGTLPGDTLNMKYEQWQATTAFGIESFRSLVDELYLVGYSTGSSLSLDYVTSHPDDELIAGLIMLSPALKASSDSAALAPWLRHIKRWLNIEADSDAAKFESFSLNAAAEFYQLTRGLSAAVRSPMQMPVFMAVSGDDATIDAEAAREFFCAKTNPVNRSMIWYQAEASGSKPAAVCSGMELVMAADSAYRLISYSHTSITLPPDDPHYGFDANYRNCLHYPENSADRSDCLTEDSKSFYGEHSLLIDGRYEGKLLRRATFNPRYEQMLMSIFCFLEQDCSRTDGSFSLQL